MHDDDSKPQELLNIGHEPAHLPYTYGFTKLVFLDHVRRLWVRSVHGLERIPKEGPALLALNHQSLLDFLCFSAVCPRRLHYIAAEKFFVGSGPWRWLMWATGQIRVDRIASDKGAVRDKVVGFLRAGRLVGVFPEGTRSPHPTRMLPGYTGVAQFALDTGAPIIPVGIRGAFETMSRSDARPKRIRSITIHVGDPISAQEHAAKSHRSRERARDELTAETMRRIAVLSGREFGGIHATQAHPERGAK